MEMITQLVVADDVPILASCRLIATPLCADRVQNMDRGSTFNVAAGTKKDHLRPFAPIASQGGDATLLIVAGDQDRPRWSAQLW